MLYYLNKYVYSMIQYCQYITEIKNTQFTQYNQKYCITVIKMTE